jgi:hypothetical protein
VFRAADLLAERGEGRPVGLHFQRGDPEAEAWLRDRANNNDVVVARRLAELLFQNGGREASGELRIRADRDEPHPATLLVERIAG